MLFAGRDRLCCALGLLLAAAAGCGRAGGAADANVSADSRANASRIVEESLPDVGFGETGVVGRLDRLRAQGHFEEFIDGALNAAAENPDDAALQLQKCEALLASGRTRESEDAALRAATLARANLAREQVSQALKLWVTARFRQSKPLDAPEFGELVSQPAPADGGSQMLEFWRDALGQRAPYRTGGNASPVVEMQMADAAHGSIPFELAAIQARANGAPLPLVFIDTGAQHTLMTVAAARAAGVSVGAGGMQLMGFKGLTAAPGVIETLELGDLVLYDVPVVVGDSAPLVALGGQMALGTELMHHVRLHVDYAARRVTAQAADAPSSETVPALWDIPVWTFSQICLARGQLPSGTMARVLIDTGDSAGTFVSYRWGRRHIPQLQAAGSPLVFRLKKRNMSLEMLELGSLTLSTWPVADTIPSELDRLNLVDVILGHDLLWPYRLSIDLRARMLQVRAGTRAPAAPGRNPDAK
jgi:hypothetical protein